MTDAEPFQGDVLLQQRELIATQAAMLEHMSKQYADVAGRYAELQSTHLSLLRIAREQSAAMKMLIAHVGSARFFIDSDGELLDRGDMTAAAMREILSKALPVIEAFVHLDLQGGLHS